MLAAASVAAPMPKPRQNARFCHSDDEVCRRSADAATAASIRDHAFGGGVTGATASASPPSRSSQNATSDASAGSCARRRSTSRRSSAPSTPSTYSAAMRLPPAAGSMVSSSLMLRDRLAVSTVRAGSSSSWCRAARSCAPPVPRRWRHPGTPRGSRSRGVPPIPPDSAARRWCCCASSTRSTAPGAGSLTASADSIGSMRRLTAPARSRSIARLRAIATSQVIGLALPGSKLAALRHTVTKTSCSTSSASLLSFKIRRQTPKSFAEVSW